MATSDQVALGSHLLVHAHAADGAALDVLDSTYNRGAFWRGLPLWCPPYRLYSMDADPRWDTAATTCHIVGNFLLLNHYWPENSFDVVVWDPPQVEDAGKGTVGAASWAVLYGNTAAVPTDLRVWFAPFLEAARLVLRPHGIIIAKMSDQVHGGVYRWRCEELRTTARGLGMQPCDTIIRTRRSTAQMGDPKWRRVLHSKRMHSEFICIRVDGQC